MNAEQAGEQLVDTFEKNLAWLMNVYNQTTISLTLEELKSFVKKHLTRVIDSSKIYLSVYRNIHFTALPVLPELDVHSYECEKYTQLLSIFLLLYSSDKYFLFYQEAPSYQNALSLYYEVGFLNTFIASSLMDYDFRQHDSIDFNSAYHPNQDLCKYLMNIYRTDIKLMAVNQDTPLSITLDDSLSNLNHKLDCKYISGGLAFIKLQAVLLFLSEAPFYSDATHEIAQQIVLFFKDFLLDSRVSRIVVDNAHLAGVQLNGVKKTTCLKIFFSLTNTDRYCLRIDFPHDDKNYIHYNLHEPYRETGIPIRISDYCELVSKYGDLSDLFFEYSNQYWFRYDFLSKLEHCTNPDLKACLIDLFNNQSHYHVFENTYSDDKMTEFLIELSSALSHMNEAGFIYGRTNDDDIQKILMKCKFEDVLLLAVEQLQALQVFKRVFPKSSEYNDDDIRKDLIHYIRAFSASETLPIELPSNLDDLSLDEILTFSTMLYDDV